MTTTPVRLSAGELRDLPKEVSRPTYSRDDLTPGIVHIGVGNFHRAHQAWYLHSLMNAGLAQDWAIIGAGVRLGDAVMREKLLAQDCLTTLIELGPEETSAEVCGAMIDFLPVEPGNAALIAQMAHPSTRIVSLTVTESGYLVEPSTGSFDANHPDAVHDAARPDAPRSAPGVIVAALSRRRAAGTGPFTVLSCDNLQGNGTLTRGTVTGLARLSDPCLADWIEETCTFPNSMVDCIVPATGPSEIEQVRAIGVDDAAPVTHENFRQWVIEDRFCAGRPPLEQVGVTLTDRVHDYEIMKLRILNAGHQVLALPAEIIGLETIADSMADPDISGFFHRLQMEEIVPRVAPVPGMTPSDYVALIERRFSNPAIRDTNRRVAYDGSSKHPAQVLPMVREALAAGGPVTGLALLEALWARMCEGTREDGSRIEPNDPAWDKLKARAEAARKRPGAWLEQAEIYGDLGAESRFTCVFEAWSTLIQAKGTRAALDTYVTTGGPL